MRKGSFYIYKNEEGTSQESITVSNSSFFDKEFAIKLTENKNLKFENQGINQYWFSNHNLLNEYSGQCDPSNPEQTDPTKMDLENEYDYGYKDNDFDYEDTWNAMTDGMYDDMPDGFDGDFDFMGY